MSITASPHPNPRHLFLIPLSHHNHTIRLQQNNVHFAHVAAEAFGMKERAKRVNAVVRNELIANTTETKKNESEWSAHYDLYVPAHMTLGMPTSAFALNVVAHNNLLALGTRRSKQLVIIIHATEREKKFSLRGCLVVLGVSHAYQ